MNIQILHSLFYRTEPQPRYSGKVFEDKPALTIYRAATQEVCAPLLPAYMGTQSRGNMGFYNFQELAELLCEWADEIDSDGFEEPPDAHQHLEPLPFDYNETVDRNGRLISRHNYH